MLQRSSSHGADCHRSTSSVHSKPESTKAEVANQHAHAAATLAFARAQEKSSTDASHKGVGFSRKNITSSSQDSQPPLQQNKGPSNVDRVVKRQQSVRFVTCTDVEGRQSTSNREVRVEPRGSFSTVRPAALRPLSRCSSLGNAGIAGEKAGFNERELAPYGPYSRKDDAVASSPASSRHVRKSRSMFMPLKAPKVFYTNGTPERPGKTSSGHRDSNLNAATPHMNSYEAPLRTPKSMSFLGLRRERDSSGSRESNDLGIQMARDRFLHQTNQQRLLEKPSFLFKLKVQRQEKQSRKFVLTSSTNSYGSPIASSNQGTTPKEFKLKDKARKARRNIKDRFRRAFGRSSKEQLDIPVQQVDAYETHVREYPSGSDARLSNFEDIPLQSEATLCQVASRPPSIYMISSSQRIESQTGSVKSIGSDRSGDNLPTTDTNATTSQGSRLQPERDIQRLSVINENGAHVPSSSLNNTPANHKLGKSDGYVPDGNSKTTPVPEHASLYHYLMKRLEDTSPQRRLEALRKKMKESVSISKDVESISSAKHVENVNAAKDVENINITEVPRRLASFAGTGVKYKMVTIKPVPPSPMCSSEAGRSPKHGHQWVTADSAHAARAEDIFGRTGPHVHEWFAADSLREARMRRQGNKVLPEEHAINEVISGLKQGRSGSDAATFSHPHEASTKTSNHLAPENMNMTPQEVAHLIEPIVPERRIVLEARSTFFGGTKYATVKTISPFRRALTESEAESSAAGAETQDANKPPSVPYSESIYSRSTGGGTPAFAKSSLTLHSCDEDIPKMSSADAGNGDAIILDRHIYRPIMPDMKGHRATSYAGSVESFEWQNWMSSEVTKLENGKANPNCASTQAAFYIKDLPVMTWSLRSRHVRENAQIIGDDTEVNQSKAIPVKQPLGTVQQNVKLNQQNIPVLKPIVKYRSSTALVLAENIDSGRRSIPPPPPARPASPPPPPIPPRSHLRPNPYPKCGLSSANAVNTTNLFGAPNSAANVPRMGRENLRSGSETAFNSPKSIGTPVNLAKRVRQSNKVSPGGGLSAAVEKQFGSTYPISPGDNWRVNGKAMDPEGVEEDDVYGAEGAGLMGPSMTRDVGGMGSLGLVNSYLSSRRRKVAEFSDES